MRAHNVGRVPVGAFVRESTTTAAGACRSRRGDRRAVQIARVAGIGADRPRLARAKVESCHRTVLRRGVREVRIVGIAACLEAVTAARVVRIAGADACAVLRAVGRAERSVVLRAAAHGVERRHVVHRHTIKLRNRQVREVTPRASFVIRFVEAAVVAEHDVIFVGGVRPDDVVIHVYTLEGERAPRPSSVGAAFEVGAHRPHGVRANRVHKKLVVITRVGIHVPRVGLRGTFLRVFVFGLAHFIRVGHGFAAATAATGRTFADARPRGA